MLDHPALEGVACDAEQLRGFDDAPAFFERLKTKKAFGFAEVEVFQKDGHAAIIWETELVEKPFLVIKTTC